MGCPYCGSPDVSCLDYAAGLWICETCGKSFWEDRAIQVWDDEEEEGDDSEE